MTVPSNPFYAGRSSRVALARRRYFDEGISPAGIVSDAVFQSWSRCLRQHGSPHERVEFQPVTASRTHLALQKNRPLHAAWQQELPELQATLGRSACTAMLTDPSGVLIGASWVGRPHEQLMPIATRLGVDLSEAAVGTTAAGVVAHSGQAVCVLGAEHFFEQVRAMNCVAAPIRDLHGQLAGILDLSSEAMPFGFDAAGVVGLFAAAIENRLLVSQATQHLVVAFQINPAMLDSPWVALVGIAADETLAWCNGVAARLLGLEPAELAQQRLAVEQVLGCGVGALASLPGEQPRALVLPSGVQVWARASMSGRDGRRGWVASAVATPARPEPLGLAKDAPAGPSEPTSLRDIDRALVARTLEACHGNVARAARQLRVSRGLIYRRLRERQPEDKPVL